MTYIARALCIDTWGRILTSGYMNDSSVSLKNIAIHHNNKFFTPYIEPAACDDAVVELPQERFDCTAAPPTTDPEGTDPQVTDPGNTDPQSTNTTTNSTVPLLASTGLLSLTPALVLVLLCRI